MARLVWVVQKPVYFLGTQWNGVDIASVITLSVVHLIALLAPFYFTWSAFWLGVALYFVTGVGVTLSFHRNLAHKSFNLPKWLEYFFAYCAVHSLQGSPLDWVSSHRSHHQFTDTPSDPHTPLKGFWFSHIGWIFDFRKRFGSYDGKLYNVGDLKKQSFYKFLHYTYPYHCIACGVVLYGIGGMPYLVWALAVRTIFVLHITFSINSICHIWGNQVWDTGDLSKNNWLFGLLAHGEGWHNNHHAFEYSARQGFEWWQIDITWYLELDWESVASGLLHDTVEDTNVVTFERIEEEFRATVRHIVEGETKVSKLGKLKCKGEHDFVQDVKAYDLRQMLLAMTEESSIIRETLQVFAPLAKLLGIDVPNQDCGRSYTESQRGLDVIDTFGMVMNLLQEMYYFGYPPSLTWFCQVSTI